MTVPIQTELGIEVWREGNAAVVSLHGSASMVDIPKLHDEIKKLAELPDSKLILNLTDLDFIGAEGIDVMVEGREISQMKHGQIRLVNPNCEIRRLLQITGLTKLMPIYDTVEQALED